MSYYKVLSREGDVFTFEHITDDTYRLPVNVTVIPLILDRVGFERFTDELSLEASLPTQYETFIYQPVLASFPTTLSTRGKK